MLTASYMARDASPEDAEDISALESELFDNGFNERTIAHELVVGTGVVKYDAEGLKAYMLLREDEDLVDLTRLGVRKDSQKLGEGTALLSMALERATNRGKTLILCALKTNHSALRLYSRHGLEVVGEFADRGAWVMSSAPLT